VDGEGRRRLDRRPFRNFLVIIRFLISTNNQVEISMKLKLILASLVSSFALPAFAQISAGTWYVVQDTSTKKCEVTSIKAVPGGTTKAVGKDTYSSKAEAKNAMDKIPECSK
jgi:hypothetical protein